MNSTSRHFNEDRLLAIPEIAKLLSVSTKTVRRLIEEGKLQALKIRGAIRIWNSELIRYLEEASRVSSTRISSER